MVTIKAHGRKTDNFGDDEVHSAASAVFLPPIELCRVTRLPPPVLSKKQR
jgi:hypothetical protein